jgi:hypothetical protein
MLKRNVFSLALVAALVGMGVYTTAVQAAECKCNPCTCATPCPCQK